MKKTVVAAVVCRGNEVLLQYRPENKPPRGWEFPGGKVEAGETLRKALQRELMEELAWNGIAGDEIYLIRRPGLELHFLRVFPRDGWSIRAQEGQRWEWFRLEGDAPEELLPNDLPVWYFLCGKFWSAPENGC